MLFATWLLILFLPGISYSHSNTPKMPSTYLERTGHFGSYDETLKYLNEISRADKRITIEEIGKSSVAKLPIISVKIDDSSINNQKKIN
jgi:hypothetical protein